MSSSSLLFYSVDFSTTWPSPLHPSYPFHQNECFSLVLSNCSGPNKLRALIPKGRELLGVDPRIIILDFITNQVGIRFSKLAFAKVKQGMGLEEADIEKIAPRAKHINVVATAKVEDRVAMFYYCLFLFYSFLFILSSFSHKVPHFFFFPLSQRRSLQFRRSQATKSIFSSLSVFLHLPGRTLQTH